MHVEFESRSFSVLLGVCRVRCAAGDRGSGRGRGRLRRVDPGAPGRWSGWITIDWAFWSAAGSFLRAMANARPSAVSSGLSARAGALWVTSSARARAARASGSVSRSQAGPSDLDELVERLEPRPELAAARPS